MTCSKILYQNISEPFLESLPELFVQLCIWEAKLDVNSMQFWLSFSSSILSTVLAFGKFFKIGPCQLLPKKKLGFGFVLVSFSIISTLALKALVLFSGIGFGPYSRMEQIGYWFSLCILPSVIMVCKRKVFYEKKMNRYFLFKTLIIRK